METASIKISSDSAVVVSSHIRLNVKYSKQTNRYEQTRNDGVRCIQRI